MRIYMAGPLFTAGEKWFNDMLAAALRLYHYEVFLPQEEQSENAKEIFYSDVEGLRNADVVVTCIDGPDVDSGTAWEIGFAYATAIPVITYKTDFRELSDKGSYANLMIAQSSRHHVDAAAPGYEMIEDLANKLATEIKSRALV